MFQSYQLAYESKTINQGSNVNVEGKDKVEMQTSVDDSGVFTEVSRSTQGSASLEPLARAMLPVR